ncbi:MAG TPA: TIGR00730 family Rossman fold protein, partial [Cyclobacteriaceae bacterium]|nr:TIGR00730 family Rossman fold protein [Cyclobacteriaceae bacterium]
IVLVGKEFWGGMLDWFTGTLVGEKMIDIKDMDLINLVDTPGEAVKVIDDFYSKYLLVPNF